MYWFLFVAGQFNALCWFLFVVASCKASSPQLSVVFYLVLLFQVHRHSSTNLAMFVCVGGATKPHLLELVSPDMFQFHLQDVLTL